MRLGVQIDAPLPLATTVDIARQALGHGFYGLWLHEDRDWNALAYLAAVAAQTERIQLGTAVANVYTRSPAALAMGALTLHHVSGGRFILGLGSSHKRLIEGFHSMSMEKPMTRVRDYATIIRRALAGETVQYEGRAYSSDGLRLRGEGAPWRVPVYLGVRGLQMARIAGEVADGVVLHMTTLDHVARVRQAIAEGARDAGRDPAEIDLACFIICNSHRDEDRARREMMDTIAFHGSVDDYRAHMAKLGFHEETEGFEREWGRGDAAAASEHVSDAMIDTLSVAPGFDEIPRRVAAFREAGVDYPILYPFPTGLHNWAPGITPFTEAGYVQTVLDAIEAAA